MRILKGFVILGAVLILVGFVLVLQRAGARGWGESTRSATAPLATGVSPSSQLPLPAGGRITHLTSWGSGIALLVDDGQGGQEILGIDTQGTVQKRLHFRPDTATNPTPPTPTANPAQPAR
ncbi:MAG: hypothetical protein HQL66_11310 [Magnetococcales bacterium]|nr:hypothetical protein [Magnetococcales bacterium]